MSRIICLSSLTEVRELVSLPSDTISTAFFRWAPPCEIGTASATASYIAVPPAGLMRASRRLTSSFSAVQSCTSCGLAPKRIRNTSSSGASSSSRKRSSACRADSIFSPAMLPLVSSVIPRLTGTRSELKCVISCGRLSS